MAERLVYWGTCEKCHTTMTLSPHPERGPLPLTSDTEDGWETASPDCPLCGHWIDIEGSDPVEGFRL